jgi:hypothetical protein
MISNKAALKINLVVKLILDDILAVLLLY